MPLNTILNVLTSKCVRDFSGGSTGLFVAVSFPPIIFFLKKIRIASTLAANNLPESCSYHFRSAMIDAKNPLASLSVDPPSRCYITNLFTCTAALSFRKRELFAVLIVK